MTDPLDLAELERLLVDPDAEDCERFTSRYGRALISSLRSAREREAGMVEALEGIRDQPDTHPTIGGRWIDWAKGRCRQALSTINEMKETGK